MCGNRSHLVLSQDTHDLYWTFPLGANSLSNFFIFDEHEDIVLLLVPDGEDASSHTIVALLLDKCGQVLDGFALWQHSYAECDVAAGVFW